MPTKLSEKDIQSWVYQNFSPVPKIIIERAYKRKLLWNKFSIIVGESKKLAATDILYLIHNRRIVRQLLDLKTAKNLLDTGFQLIKTTDQFYFLQLIDFNLDILQDNWIPLYQLLQESKEEKDVSPVYIYSEKQQTTFFDQNKEEPKEKPVRKQKTATKTTSET